MYCSQTAVDDFFWCTADLFADSRICLDRIPPTVMDYAAAVVEVPAFPAPMVEGSLSCTSASAVPSFVCYYAHSRIFTHIK